MIPLAHLLPLPLMLLCASVSAAERSGYPVRIWRKCSFSAFRRGLDGQPAAHGRLRRDKAQADGQSLSSPGLRDLAS
jgi:hypothetical protein